MTPFELTRKSAVTGDYLDLCNRCFSTIEKEIDVDERFDLLGINNSAIDDMSGGLSDDEEGKETSSNSTEKSVAVQYDDE